MKKVFLYLNIIIACATFVMNYVYMTEGGVLLKGICCIGFALMGIVNLIYAAASKKKSIKFHAVMALGLVLAMTGDVVLGFDFIIGASLFALGHVCYFIAQCFFMKPRWMDAVISAVIFACAGSFLMFFPKLNFDNDIMKYVCFVYALIISVMVGKALSNVIAKPGLVTVVLAVGSVLFFFSDLMLVFDWFMDMSTGKLCMGTYIPAQCLLAFSSYLHEKID